MYRIISLFLLLIIALPTYAQTANYVDLLWQTNTYTPPFYKGKALYTTQSTVTVVAVPSIKSNNLIYTWKQDYKVLGSLSGLGKDSYTFKGTVLSKPTTIEVEVSTAEDGLKATKDITLSARNPEPIIYEDDPLYGILYNKAITSPLALSKDEIVLLASPYFFSTDVTGKNNLEYEWSINNGNVADNTDRSIILRHEGDTVGSSDISLVVNNTVDFFQKTRFNFKVNFGVK
ncbi:MAG: hypothetical protein NUV47_01505 [Patescibacteria group bacterium]|nr:hypothetical protein [Patescibacteria group bacterium]